MTSPTPDTVKPEISTLITRCKDTLRDLHPVTFQETQDFYAVFEAAASAVELGERLAASAEVQTSMAMDRTNLRERVKALEAALDGAEKALQVCVDVFDDAAFIGIFSFANNHGVKYSGPTVNLPMTKTILANLAAVRSNKNV